MTTIPDNAAAPAAAPSAAPGSQPPPAAPGPDPLAGNPGTVGIPTVIAGALGLGLVDIGYLPASAAGAAVPIIMSATAVGLLLATIWAAALGQNASASLYAVFFGFYGSYAVLALGLSHNWFGIAAGQAVKTEATWIICWLVTIGILTIVTVRLPVIFTILLGMVDVALVLLLVGTLNGSVPFTRAGAVVVFLFIALAVYIYADIMSRETGGRGLPLGKPLLA